MANSIKLTINWTSYTTASVWLCDLLLLQGCNSRTQTITHNPWAIWKNPMMGSIIFVFFCATYCLHCAFLFYVNIYQIEAPARKKKYLDVRPWKHDHRCYRFLSFINKMPTERLPCLGGLFHGLLPGLIPLLFLNKSKILGCKWEKKPLPRPCKGRPKAQGLCTHLVFWDLDQVTWLPCASVSSHFMGPPPEEAQTSSSSCAATPPSARWELLLRACSHSLQRE